MLSLLTNKAEKETYQCALWVFALKPAVCFYIFLAFMTIFSKSKKKKNLIQYRDHLVWMSVNCEVKAKCLSVITVWQNRCTPVLHHYTKADSFVSPFPPNRPSKASSSCINLTNHIKRWLISMTTNYFHNLMIPYLSPFSARPFVRASKHSLQIGLI